MLIACACQGKKKESVGVNEPTIFLWEEVQKMSCISDNMPNISCNNMSYICEAQDVDTHTTSSAMCRHSLVLHLWKKAFRVLYTPRVGFNLKLLNKK